MEEVPGVDDLAGRIQSLRVERQSLRESGTASALERNRVELSRAVRLESSRLESTRSGVVSEPRYTICVDLDGVLHSYDSPYLGVAEIPDPPVEGAVEWLREMVRHFRVVVHTTRARSPEGCAAVWEWLFQHAGAEVAQQVYITSQKEPALVYIDDRAWRFEGPGTFPTRDDIHRALPWHKR